MKRAVSVLEVSDVDVWADLDAVVDPTLHFAQTLSPTRRIVTDAFERDVLPQLGDRVLVRYARRDAAEQAATRADLANIIAKLPIATRNVLFAAQRHALDDGIVFGVHAWDPEHDGPAVRALHGAGLIMALPDDEAPAYCGRYRLNPDLPAPPPIDYDFEDAVMDETEDLGEPRSGPMALLHDLAALAAALHRVAPRRTHRGALDKNGAKAIGRALAVREIAAGDPLEEHPRWGRALRALDALNVISMEPLKRTLHLDLGLEHTLSGGPIEAADRLVHRLIDRDLHVVLPAIRRALSQAGDGAVDDMVFRELLCEQHREVIFPRWRRHGQSVYPVLGTEVRPFDDEGFDAIEGRMVGRALARCEVLGLVRRAPGVFAATSDGRRWAGATAHAPPPVWLTGDLEVMVPPDAITPWERLQIERLSKCLARDTVDRYRLDRPSMIQWLRTHDLEEAMAVLSRRCPAVPQTVKETLHTLSLIHIRRCRRS